MAEARNANGGLVQKISQVSSALVRQSRLATADIPGHNAKIRAMRDRLIRGVLEKIPNARLNGHPEKRLPGNFNISFEFIEGESMLLWLDDEGDLRIDRKCLHLRFP